MITFSKQEPRYWGRRNKKIIVAPIMGTALEFICGTADINDVIEIHRRIENLEQSVEKKFPKLMNYRQ